MIKIIDHTKNYDAYGSIKHARSDFLAGIRDGLFDIGNENVKHLKKLIRSKDKNGRLYFFRGKIHQASAPGEAPANMTGKLANTTKYKVRGSYQCEFGDTVFYGPYLEHGTSKMEPRPHVKRTVKEKSRDNFNALNDNVKRRLK